MAEGPKAFAPLGGKGGHDDLKAAKEEIAAINAEIAKAAKAGKLLDGEQAMRLARAQKVLATANRAHAAERALKADERSAKLFEKLTRTASVIKSLRAGDYSAAIQLLDSKAIERSLQKAGFNRAAGFFGKVGPYAGVIAEGVKSAVDAYQQTKEENKTEREILNEKYRGNISQRELELFTKAFDRSLGGQSQAVLENFLSDYGLAPKRGTGAEEGRRLLQSVKQTGGYLGKELLSSQQVSAAIGEALGGKPTGGESLKQFIATSIDVEQQRLGRTLSDDERAQDFNKAVAEYFADMPPAVVQTILDKINEAGEKADVLKNPAKRRKTQAEMNDDVVKEYKKDVAERVLSYRLDGWRAAREHGYQAESFSD